jgi:RNA polymerase sigma-70 factor (ECF subfamily)
MLLKPLEFAAAMLPSSSVVPDGVVFDSVVGAYRSKIFRFALSSLRDRDVAETITQDCFMKAHRAWGNFRNECSLDSWLMKIAINLIRDHARNRRLQFWRRAEASAPTPEWVANLGDSRERSPEERAILEQRLNAVWNAAATLPERQRTVFLLRFVEEMDLLEIAATTGMKEGTVKTHLFRALHAVRERAGLSS